MKKELLSPAGDFECLKAAIHAGCDAVYIGGKKFGARKFAHNFTNEEIVEAVKFCHLYGVKLYVTVNTVVYEEEMEEVLEYVYFLYKSHVDALIVQDIGLIYEIHKRYPDFELHASTQLHNICQENCQILEELGVKRVVLARELTLSEIEAIKTPLEKEAFIHGALCICYSGECLFSSLVMNRSGNRGECSGMCRLPYTLENSSSKIPFPGSYLLSTRELCTVSRLEELMKSDITCFKIEGRMKSPLYVYFVTKIYRKLMDQYERGEKLEITKEDLETLQVLYNRKFTEGHLFNKTEKDLMNIESPNHSGITLGKVLAVTPSKIKISLLRPLRQGDGIRFLENQEGMTVNFLYDSRGKLIREAKKGDTVYVRNHVHLLKSSDVVKTSDSKLYEDFLSASPRKVPIEMKFIARENKELKLEIWDGKNLIQVSSGKSEVALKLSTTKEEVYNQLNRLGETPYQISSCKILMDEHLFIPKKEINHLRMKAIEKLTEARLFRKDVQEMKKYVPKISKSNEKDVQICCLVRSEEQLKSALEFSVKRIYVTDFKLYQKYKNYPGIFYRMERIHPDNKSTSSHVATELWQLEKSPLATDYYLNVTNSSFLQYLKEKKVHCVTLSKELTLPQIKNIASKETSLELEVLVYGRVELMIMKYCPLSLIKRENNSTDSNSYFLVDRNKKRYPLLFEQNLTHIFSYQKEWFQEKEKDALIKSGISYIRLEFFEENAKEVKNILEKYQQWITKTEKIC